MIRLQGLGPYDKLCRVKLRRFDPGELSGEVAESSKEILEINWHGI